MIIDINFVGLIIASIMASAVPLILASCGELITERSGVLNLGVDEDKISDNASFIDDLGADSLDTVELVMAFEEEFGCEIPDDAAEKILTIKDAISFIESADG